MAVAERFPVCWGFPKRRDSAGGEGGRRGIQGEGRGRGERGKKGEERRLREEKSRKGGSAVETDRGRQGPKCKVGGR